MSKQRLTFGQSLKKDFINVLSGLLTALLTGIVFYFGAKFALTKLFDQLGKPPVTNAVHKK